MKRVWKRMFGKVQMRVLLLGLDAAGKTSQHTQQIRSDVLFEIRA